MKCHHNWIFYLNKRDSLDPKLKRYVYSDGSVYISDYKINEKKEYDIRIWNFHGITGEEFFEEFTLPKSRINKIETITTSGSEDRKVFEVETT